MDKGSSDLIPEGILKKGNVGPCSHVWRMRNVESVFNVSLAMNSYAILEGGRGRFLERRVSDKI